MNKKICFRKRWVGRYWVILGWILTKSLHLIQGRNLKGLCWCRKVRTKKLWSSIILSLRRIIWFATATHQRQTLCSKSISMTVKLFFLFKRFKKFGSFIMITKFFLLPPLLTLKTRTQLTSSFCAQRRNFICCIVPRFSSTFNGSKNCARSAFSQTLATFTSKKKAQILAAATICLQMRSISRNISSKYSVWKSCKSQKTTNYWLSCGIKSQLWKAFTIPILLTFLKFMKERQIST